MSIAEIRALAARVAADVYGPMAEELDVNRVPISVEERRRLGDLGFLGIAHPERFGGSGAPLAQALAVIEEFGKVCRPAAFQIFEANTGPAQVINHLATEEQRERWLPDIVSGEKTMAVAISEPDAGSAATDMRTTAKPVERGLHPQRQQAVDLQRRRGRPVPGLLPALRRPGRQGHRRHRRREGHAGASRSALPERLMGFRGIPSADVVFDDVVVPRENVVVPAGDFGKLFGVFSIERLGNSTMSLAIGQEALDRTVKYVEEREQFGKPLVEFQSVQVMLADMVLQVEAARLLLERAAAGRGHAVSPIRSRSRSPSARPMRWPSGSPTSRCRCTAATATPRSTVSSVCTVTPTAGPSRAGRPPCSASGSSPSCSGRKFDQRH